MTSCNPCSYISMAAQIQELRNSFTSTDTDLPCNKYKHTQGLPWLSPKKIPALLMQSWRFQRTLKELNPPVCRERFPCQGIGRDTARGQEDTGSFLYQASVPFGVASQSLDSLLLPGHPASLLDGIWGLCLAEDGKQRKSTPKTEGTPNPPQKQEGSKPTPKPERSEVRGNADGKKQEKIKVGLWHHGLPINSATAPDLRSRGRSRPPLGIQVRRLRACFPTGQCSFF